MDKQNVKIAVVGGGSWATAIVKILCENLLKVNWWVRNEYIKEYILTHEHNPNYLSSVEFEPEKLFISVDINEIVSKSDIIIFAVPSIYLEECMEHFTGSLSDKIVVSAIKGIVPKSLKLVGNYLADEFKMNMKNFGVISGPCHAEEIALERLSYLTIAAEQIEIAEKISALMRCDYVKVKTSNDVFGIEFATILKNIYALAAGIAHGLGYGDNFQAVLMSNAAKEMNRFVNILSPKERNISESAYLGDLLVTGYSYFSRNRMLGNMLGKGYTVKSAILEMNMVAEGYYATKAIYDFKDNYDIKVPIISAVHKILYRGKNPKKVFKVLSEKLS